MSEPTLQDCINYMRRQIRQMEKYPRSYEFNLPYYRKTVELLEKDRPHGTWEFDDLDNDYRCSKCHGFNDFITDFCPNCGADMRKK